MRQVCLVVLLITLLTPTVQAELKIRDVKRSYTPWGPVRPTANYFAGDRIIMPFSLEGLDLDKGDSLALDLGTALISSKGKTVLSQVVPLKGKPVLKGKSLWCAAVLPLTNELELGSYTFRINVENRDNGETTTFEESIELVKPTLAFRVVQFFYDPKLSVIANDHLLVGQKLFFRAGVTGLEDLKGMYKVTQSFSILDAETKKVIHSLDSVPQTKNVGKPGAVWTVFGQTGTLTRPGKFILRLKLTDHVVEKTVTADVGFEVLSP